MTCTFFGHKDAPKETEQTLRSVLINLIENEDVNIFYVGNNGSFDSTVISLLSELSFVYPIKYYVVLAYIPKKETDYSERSIIPEGIESVPLRFAISYRNKWMIEQSDFVVTHVTRSWGGAAQFKSLAERKEKAVINII